jgi:hypothetical protein
MKTKKQKRIKAGAMNALEQIQPNAAGIDMGAEEV